ncbi:hypothetical protein AABB24_003221 [Solanum stoloniferum]|uniref:Uncharacterized protein n=1 Tax=Solanum stoloniferum TaxID=62892 RepID=A0ABD2V935_9SOLN
MYYISFLPVSFLVDINVCCLTWIMTESLSLFLVFVRMYKLPLFICSYEPDKYLRLGLMKSSWLSLFGRQDFSFNSCVNKSLSFSLEAFGCLNQMIGYIANVSS